MTSNEDLIERIGQAIAFFERQTGQVPSIDQLASKLSIDPETIRKAILNFLSDKKQEGTSAFRTSLLDLLMSGLQIRGILDHEVLLIDNKGIPLGIFSAKDALRMARDKGLDIFLIQPDANPPVARILDYGRYKFESEKRTQEIKKRYHISEIKELKMRYKIDDQDYQIKLNSAKKILKDGAKINVYIILRGRETEHANMAIALMKRFADDLHDLATIHKAPHLEGKTVIMLLSPVSKTRRPR